MGFVTGVQGIYPLLLLEVALLAGILSGLILTGLTILISVTAYSRGWDPDIVTSPSIATLGDFITILCIYLTIMVVI
jgi:cation transporter-like permease